jgi:hypothetical protein
VDVQKESDMPIIVKSKREGFRRCGVAFSKKAKEYPDDFFDAEQLAILDAEPMLEVTGVDYPEEQTAQGDGVVKTPVDAVDGQHYKIHGYPMNEAEFLNWLEEKTVAELKQECADLEIDVPAKAKKADLIELITFNTAFPAAEA